MEGEQFIYHMGLHDMISGGNDVKVLRVPGGWIYSDGTRASITRVFVPYNEEFLKEEK
jgi:hypothetical protein